MKKINVLFCLLLVISFDYNLQSGPRSRIASPLVVSYYQQAQDAGYRILKAGGNAFDAFVAVTAVENVLSSGEVTLAGLL
ncbi:MAG: gamma-glutamyltransferase, partial [Candidatus Aminicenantes bacterium]|nr:gamma-glutamyltransferase [Candidatus Aminicenantes bacterium]